MSSLSDQTNMTAQETGPDVALAGPDSSPGTSSASMHARPMPVGHLHAQWQWQSQAETHNDNDVTAANLELVNGVNGNLSMSRNPLLQNIPHLADLRLPPAALTFPADWGPAHAARPAPILTLLQAHTQDNYEDLLVSTDSDGDTESDADGDTSSFGSTVSLGSDEFENYFDKHADRLFHSRDSSTAALPNYILLVDKPEHHVCRRASVPVDRLR
jgi:hypothetical protein